MRRSVAFVVAGTLLIGACNRGNRPAGAGNLAPRNAASQPAPATAELVDRVVAVVGDSVILSLDVEEAIMALQAAGQTLPTDSAARARLRSEMLDSKISELLLLQAAFRDTVKVPDEQVEQELQQELAQRQKTFGTQEAFEAALRRENLSLLEYRAIRERDIRRGAMIQRYISQVERQRRAPSIREEEIRAYFEAQKARLGERPATVTFQQAIVVPQPSDTARANARKQAEDLLARIKAGEEFETLARRYSADPGSKEKGGDLGWFRRESMMTNFSNAAYALRTGEVSGLVETPFGFHIIKLEKVRAAERQARHILIQPSMTAEDAQHTRALADSLAASVKAGASIDSLSKIYSDPNEQAKVGPYPMDRLPEPYKTSLAGVPPGAVVGPLPLEAEIPGAEKFTIVKVLEVAQAGEYSLDDPLLRSQVREQLQRQKLVAELVAELKKRNYIDIRP
jgi:peptidyl-prolyl cis-trans isomerase SurA